MNRTSALLLTCALVAAVPPRGAAAAPPTATPTAGPTATPAPGSAPRGGLVDARIDFPFADDNVLRDAGEDRQSSPTASFTPPRGLRYESFLHLGLHKALDLGGRFVPEGAIYLKLDVADKGTLRDDSSYLRLNVYLDDARTRSLFVQLLPVDADRDRLGFHWEISWGGTDTFPRNFRGSLAPGARLGVRFPSWYAFAGAKTALVRSAAEQQLANEQANSTLFVERTFYGLFGGAGVQLGLDGLWLEANGGFFQKGTNNKAEVLGKPIDAGGVSAQLSYTHGLPIERRIDLRLYRSNPVDFDVTHPVQASRGVSWRAAGEFTYLFQTLADLDAPGSTKREASRAAFLELALQVGRFRLHLDGEMRDLTFITFNVPGFIPNAALPAHAQTTPEWSATLAADHTWDAGSHHALTPFVQGSLQRPATYRGIAQVGANAPYTLDGVHRVVVRGSDPGDWDLLPADEDARWVWGVKVGLRWTYARWMTLLAEIGYTRDANRTQIRKDEFGIATRQFIDPNILGFGILASMRF